MDFDPTFLYPADIERRLIRGFVCVGTEVPDRERKVLAAKLRARIVSVELCNRSESRISLKDLGDHLNRTERNLRDQFGSRDAVFAFPPPELATALAATIAAEPRWECVVTAIPRLLFELQANPEGCALIASLANLRASDEAMGANDNHFSFALASGLRCVAERLAPNQLDWVGYMTEGFRRIFKRWALDSNVPMGHCSEELVKLLQPLEAERNRHKARKLLID